MSSNCSHFNCTSQKCSSAFGKAMRTSIKPTKYWDSGFIRDDRSDNVSKFSPITDKSLKF